MSTVLRPYHSTAFKNTSDTIRHALGVDKLIDDADELPELVVRELTSEEIEQMTKRQIKEYGAAEVELEVVEEG